MRTLVLGLAAALGVASAWPAAAADLPESYGYAVHERYAGSSYWKYGPTKAVREGRVYMRVIPVRERVYVDRRVRRSCRTSYPRWSHHARYHRNRACRVWR